MNEQTLLPQPDPPPQDTATASDPAPRNRLPWVSGLGFIVLAAAIVYVWQHPRMPAEPPAEVAALHALDQHLAGIDMRLVRLEQRPTADFGRITTEIDALEHRIADQTQFGNRLDEISGRLESLSGRLQASVDAAKQQSALLTGRVSALEANTGSIETVTKRLNRVARIQEASLALDFGRPIGDLPDAPADLARYSHTAPPTEASLRVRFARAEQAALAAKQPSETDAPFVDRVWDRAQSLITVHSGDNVIVGTPAAIVLNRAQMDLDAGDLAAAVASVGSLKGQPAEAMADWLGDANALLNARSALAQMADHA